MGFDWLVDWLIDPWIDPVIDPLIVLFISQWLAEAIWDTSGLHFLTGKEFVLKKKNHSLHSSDQTIIPLFDHGLGTVEWCPLVKYFHFRTSISVLNDFFFFLIFFFFFFFKYGIEMLTSRCHTVVVKSIESGTIWISLQPFFCIFFCIFFFHKSRVDGRPPLRRKPISCWSENQLEIYFLLLDGPSPTSATCFLFCGRLLTGAYTGQAHTGRWFIISVCLSVR